jgi:hypothetical protein
VTIQVSENILEHKIYILYFEKLEISEVLFSRNPSRN